MLISFANHFLQSVLNFVGLVGLFHLAFVFGWSRLFIPGNFLGLNFFSWLFRGCKGFSHGCIVCVSGGKGGRVMVNKSNLAQNCRNWKDFFKEVNTENYQSRNVNNQ